jgi:hypothetical protein
MCTSSKIQEMQENYLCFILAHVLKIDEKANYLIGPIKTYMSKLPHIDLNKNQNLSKRF